MSPFNRWLLLLLFIAPAILLASENDAEESPNEEVKMKPGQGEFSNARRVAADRAKFSMRPDNGYSEPLAQYFAADSPEELEKIISMMSSRVVYPRNHVSTIVTRHMLIDRMMFQALTTEAHGPRQVVILGAGFDTRAYRYAHMSGVRWYEIDLPAPQEFKKQIIKKHGMSSTAEITRIPHDLTKDDWVDGLKQSGWDPNAPTLYILEGLVYYLTAEQARDVLHSIPNVPHSRIIVSIVNQSNCRLFESYGMPVSIWKSNLENIRAAGGLEIPGYKFYLKKSGSFPRQGGLSVDVVRIKARHWWQRLLWKTPSEDILEFVAG